MDDDRLESLRDHDDRQVKAGGGSGKAMARVNLAGNDDIAIINDNS
jgi:hypothetical protein